MGSLGGETCDREDQCGTGADQPGFGARSRACTIESDSDWGDYAYHAISDCAVARVPSKLWVLVAFLVRTGVILVQDRSIGGYRGIHRLAAIRPTC